LEPLQASNSATTCCSPGSGARERDIESPAHVSECHEGCAIKGFWDYVLNRGGKLAVDFVEGRFVFCFMPLGDFAPPQ
jgi:hypothetical protein